MAKSELGTKRLCAGCSAKFYDLNKNPIICPKCGTVFEVAPATRSRAEAPREAEEVVAKEAEADLVSLEEADADKTGKVKTTNADDDIDIEDDIVDDDDDDSTFIPDEEEGDDDVSDIIGDVNDDDDN